MKTSEEAAGGGCGDATNTVEEELQSEPMALLSECTQRLNMSQWRCGAIPARREALRYHNYIEDLILD